MFLKRDVEISADAAEWLRGVDVKYDRFSGVDDIAPRIRSAIIDEITRGYRRYRIQNVDYKSIAESVRSAPVSFVVRTIRPEELTIVSAEFPQLAELYPNLEEWIGRKRVEIIEQKAVAYVATHGGISAGFALTSDKGQGGKEAVDSVRVAGIPGAPHRAALIVRRDNQRCEGRLFKDVCYRL